MQNQYRPEHNHDNSESQTSRLNIDVIELFTQAQHDVQRADGHKGEGHWEVTKSDPKSGIDALKMKSVQNVSRQQFQIDNPGIDVEKLDKNKTYKYATYQSRIDDGWQVEGANPDRTLRLSKEFELNVNHNKDHRVFFETVKEVSNDFRKQVESKINQIPKGIRDALEKAGYKTILAPTVIDGLPELSGKAHAGWTQDFRYVDGTQDAEQKLMVFGETRLDDNDKRSNARINQPGHQFGHAFDSLGQEDIGTYFSASIKFLKVFDEDIKNMKPEDKDNPKDKDGELTTAGYLTQKGGRGARETFASIFGMLTNGPENPGDDKEIRRLFPLTIEYMKNQLLPKYNN